jgi:hypothetical protein
MPPARRRCHIPSGRCASRPSRGAGARRVRRRSARSTQRWPRSAQSTAGCAVHRSAHPSEFARSHPRLGTNRIGLRLRRTYRRFPLRRRRGPSLIEIAIRTLSETAIAIATSPTWFIWNCPAPARFFCGNLVLSLAVPLRVGGPGALYSPKVTCAPGSVLVVRLCVSGPSDGFSPRCSAGRPVDTVGCA